MQHKDVFILEDIVKFCDRISNAIERFGESQEAFLSDEIYQDVCAFSCLQIGELANSLSDTFKEQHPEIGWRDIISLRNIVAHEYGNIDPIRLWATLNNDIPPFRNSCAGMIGIK